MRSTVKKSTKRASNGFIGPFLILLSILLAVSGIVLPYFPSWQKLCPWLAKTTTQPRQPSSTSFNNIASQFGFDIESVQTELQLKHEPQRSEEEEEIAKSGVDLPGLHPMNYLPIAGMIQDPSILPWGDTFLMLLKKENIFMVQKCRTTSSLEGTVPMDS